MSTRQETYCDCCGNQMSQTNHGSTGTFGVRLRVVDRNSNAVDWAMIGLHVKALTDCGSHSFAKFLNKRDFCSVQCLRETITEWLSEVSRSAPGNIRDKA